MPDARPPNSNRTKRKVRKRCCFGCVICGLPVFQYDHIAPPATAGEPGERDVALLCPPHHAEAQAGALSAGRVREMNEQPFNCTAASTAGGRIGALSQDELTFQVGGNQTTMHSEADGHYPLIWIDSGPALSVFREDDQLLLGLRLHSAAGVLVLAVDRGEVTVSTGAWDYEREGNVVTIRSEPHETEVRLAFEGNAIRLARARMRGAFGTELVVLGDRVAYRVAGGRLLAFEPDVAKRDTCWVFFPGGSTSSTVAHDGFVGSPVMLDVLQALIDRAKTRRFATQTAALNKDASIYAGQLAFRQGDVKSLAAWAKAIEWSVAALSYFTRDSHPVDFAALNSNLGTYFWHVAMHESTAENLQRSAHHLRQALSVEPPIYDGLLRAQTFSKLGRTLTDLIARTGSLEPEPEAAEMLQQALWFYRRANLQADIDVIDENLKKLSSLKAKLAQ